MRKRYALVAPVTAGVGGFLGYTKFGIWGAVIGAVAGLVGGLMATAGISAAVDYAQAKRAEKHLGIK